MSRTLEDLLRMQVSNKQSPDFRVRVQEITQDGVRIIIHADGHNSETKSFFVCGNTLNDRDDVRFQYVAEAQPQEQTSE